MSVTALHPAPDATHHEVNFGELLRTLDGEFGARAPGLIERFKFDLDGMTFDARRIAQKNGYRFLVTARLGCMPFSIESAERRNAIKAIVLAARRLPKVQFAIDPSGKITAGALFDVIQTVAPDFIFYPLTLFLQEARPFMKLIGQYLEAPHLVPKPPAPNA